MPAATSLNTFLKYGIPSELGNRLTNLELTVSTIKGTSNFNLTSKYGLSNQEVKIVKTCIKRHPIDDEVVLDLLENSNYTCCICKGVKSDSYIIHHIEKYSISQDNSYYNLAVLCPNDHDLAHKEGETITNKISADEIRSLKQKWERQVKEQNIYKASTSGDINEIDFIYIPRIIELCQEILGQIPQTKYTQVLLAKELIDNTGALNIAKISGIADNINTPLIFFAPYGSTTLIHHYFEIFKGILKKIQFHDLDSLLNKNKIKAGIVGQYCFYVGGLYAKRAEYPVTEQTEVIRLHFRRKPYFVEWLVDPKYFASTTAKSRISNRNIYLIYGKIRNVDTEQVNGENFIKIDVRPYVFGLPKESKNRTPPIHYKKEYESLLEEE